METHKQTKKKEKKERDRSYIGYNTTGCKYTRMFHLIFLNYFCKRTTFVVQT